MATFRYLFALLILGGLGLSEVTAQTQSAKLRRIAKNKVYRLLSEYERIIDFQGYNQFGENKAQAFRDMCLPTAMIFDDMVPEREPSTNRPIPDSTLERFGYRLIERPLEDYISRTKQLYPKGLQVVRIQKASVDFSQFSEGRVKILIEKFSRGNTNETPSARMIDTSLQVIELQIIEDTVVKIAAIRAARAYLTTTSGVYDYDGDGIPDEQDLCVFVHGAGCPTGCPDDCADPFTPHIRLSTWFTVGNGSFDLGAPAVNDLGIAGLNTDATSLAGWSQESSGSILPAIGLELDFVFNKNWAVSIGAHSLSFGTSTSLDSLRILGEQADGSGDPYEAIINGSSIQTEVSTRYIGVPILIKFFGTLGSKSPFGYFLHAGPMIGLPVGGAAEGDAVYDFEARYAYRNGDWVYIQTPDAGDWLITEEQINRLNGNNAQQTQDYFESRQEAGYQVGLDQTQSGSDDFLTNTSLWLLVRGGISYEVSKKISLCLGGTYMAGQARMSSTSSASFPTLSESYQPLALDRDRYRISALGVALGIQVSLKSE